uniref:Uncharacterized protein n=1 Tax=viral metagenome TaxID=1070528 RepID=A0A6C0CAJ1_9ZZZZ
MFDDIISPNIVEMTLSKDYDLPISENISSRVKIIHT